MEDEWFREWFNSPYYHQLYRHRDEKEAAQFIDELCNFLKLQPGQKVLDAACGKGRHAIQLNTKGLDVTGIDLSEESIHEASAYENDKLHFYMHDMRHLFRTNYYDIVLNLFTSFGYFKTTREDQQTIDCFAKGLVPGGRLVLDYLNTEKAEQDLVNSETKLIEGLEFRITKTIEKDFIVKHIRFSDKGKQYYYKEEVKRLLPADFENYFRHSGLKILHLCGNYQLEPFNKQTSERLIFICQKPA